ncbi:MAG: ABC transporter ATP-binding protein [Selenomonadaceae bacterium]|nr:ABC transporter ATP-binding protein [Selenomonadaceae bacterium]
MLLQLSDVDISYNDNVIVKGVNLELDSGERLSIVGESGSGKTTVIRAVLGVLPRAGKVTNGKIIYDGKNILEFTPKEWKKVRGKEISMIFQDSGNMMNPVQKIGDQFIEYITTQEDTDKKSAYEKAVKMLSLTNLPNPENVMNSYTFELSGGMRQRVGIAMAITFEPKLLLADEPTSALDVTTQAQIVKELMKITKSSMIIVTHNIGVAAALGDKLMVMQGGKVVEYGKTTEVIENPKAEYTKTLLSAVPEIGGKRYA